MNFQALFLTQQNYLVEKIVLRNECSLLCTLSSIETNSQQFEASKTLNMFLLSVHISPVKSFRLRSMEIEFAQMK